MIPVSCTMCTYFTPDLKNPNGTGICRRHPPTMFLLPNKITMFWPSVRPQDWCGEGESGISHDSVAAGKSLLDKKDGDHK